MKKCSVSQKHTSRSFFILRHQNCTLVVPFQVYLLENMKILKIKVHCFIPFSFTQDILQCKKYFKYLLKKIQKQYKGFPSWATESISVTVPNFAYMVLKYFRWKRTSEDFWFNLLIKESLTKTVYNRVLKTAKDSCTNSWGRLCQCSVILSGGLDFEFCPFYSMFLVQTFTFHELKTM